MCVRGEFKCLIEMRNGNKSFTIEVLQSNSANLGLQGVKVKAVNRV